MIELDLAGPLDDAEEAGINRVVKMIKGRRKLVDVLLAMPPWTRKVNVVYLGLLKHPDFRMLKKRVTEDKVFEKALRRDLVGHFGAGYAEKLLQVFGPSGADGT